MGSLHSRFPAIPVAGVFAPAASRVRQALRAGMRAPIAVLAMLAMLFASSGASAQTSANANANASTAETAVAISTASSLSNTGDLDFGSIIATGVAGTVTIAPDGGVTNTGGTIPMGGSRAASFLLERDVGIQYPTGYSPILPSTVEITHETDPSATMTIRDLTSDFDRTRQIFIFTVPGWWGLTEYDFRVGGTLDVAADQLPGVYTGTFTVQVDFQ